VENPSGMLLLVTAPGGAVAIDEPLLRLWRIANGRTLDALQRESASTDVHDIVPHAVACLAEARLLQRDPAADNRICPTTTHRETTVSAIIVVSSAAELPWLAGCLASLQAQRARPAEIILVDNGGVMPEATPAGSIPVRVLLKKRRASYPAALNEAVMAAGGSFLLLLNADVSLEPAALGHMLETAASDPRIAAVAPKLLFWRTPAFLNGIGNRVRDIEWGSDNAIGQLDLGQFDHWTDVPSGCFAALLVSAAACRDVGPFDTGYPAYFEDTDWAYRARALGYRVAAAPAAEVLHVFGASWDATGAGTLTHAKLARAASGRLRFLWKIPAQPRQRRLIGRCLWRDFHAARAAEHMQDPALAWAHIRGVLLFAAGLPGAAMLRRDLQRRRRVDDAELFTSETSMPSSSVHGSTPVLTSTLIRDYYAPLIRSGRTRSMPEVAACASGELRSTR